MQTGCAEVQRGEGCLKVQRGCIEVQRCGLRCRGASRCRGVETMCGESVSMCRGTRAVFLLLQRCVKVQRG